MAGAARGMGFGQGAGFLLQGIRLWRTRTRLMALGIVPAVIAMILLTAAFIGLVLVLDDLIAWATPFANDWADAARSTFRTVVFIGVLAGAVMLSIVTFTGLTLAVGDPFYEKIWKQVEISLGGEIPERGVGWIRGALDGLVLVAMGLATAVIVFVIGLLPVIGAIIGATLGLIVSGRLLAGELVSRPLEARGMDRAARADLMRQHRGAMLGFGVCVQACFLVPFGGILVMPAAVAGATYLARQALESQPS